MECTFAMIKPNAVENNDTGAILQMIEKSGFKIRALNRVEISINQAKKFYAIHEGKPFFHDLITFISRSPVVVMALEKENAVVDFRTLIGDTNPKDAKPGTIRKLFADSLEENAIHGSDSLENATMEINFHFSSKQLIA